MDGSASNPLAGEFRRFVEIRDMSDTVIHRQKEFFCRADFPSPPHVIRAVATSKPTMITIFGWIMQIGETAVSSAITASKYLSDLLTDLKQLSDGSPLYQAAAKATSRSGINRISHIAQSEINFSSSWTLERGSASSYRRPFSDLTLLGRAGQKASWSAAATSCSSD
jgi:hypothetical protein